MNPLLLSFPEGLCEIIAPRTAFDFLFQSLKGKKSTVLETSQHVQCWEALVKCPVGDLRSLLLTHIVVPRSHVILSQLLHEYLSRGGDFAALLHSAMADWETAPYPHILLLEELLQWHMTQPAEDLGVSGACARIPALMLQAMRGEEGRPTRLLREAWNLSVLAMLGQVVCTKGETYSWTAHYTLVDAVELWASVNEHSHQRMLLVEALKSVGARLEELTKQKYNLEYAQHQNRNHGADPALRAAETALDACASRAWLSWGSILLDFPGCGLTSRAHVPSSIVGGTCQTSLRPTSIYDSLEGISHDVWSLLDGIQQCEQSGNDSHIAWKKDAVVGLALLLGKVPDAIRVSSLLSHTMGNLRLEATLYEVLIHHVLRVVGLEPLTYRLASKMVGAITSHATTTSDVTLENFLPLLDERDAAGRCVVEIVSDLCCRHPTTALPQLFHLLDDNRSNVRHNALDIIDHLLCEERNLSTAVAERLTTLIVDRLGDEELALRCQASKMARVLPLASLIPKLLELASQRDGTGKTRGASLAALSAAAKGHATDVSILAVCLDVTRQGKVARATPITPRDLTEYNSPSTIEGKLLHQAVLHVAEKWATYVPPSLWEDLITPLLHLYLDDVSNSCALRVLTSLNTRLSSHASVVVATLMPVLTEGSSDIMRRLGPLLLLNTFGKAFFSQTEVSSCEALWSFVSDVLSQSEGIPDDMKRLAAMVLSKRPLGLTLERWGTLPRRQGLFEVCCALMVCVQDEHAVTSDVEAFRFSSPIIVSSLEVVMSQIGSDEKLGKACIDTLAVVTLFELRFVQSEQVVGDVGRHPVEKFLLTCLSRECMTFTFLHRSLCFTAVHQAFFHVRTNRALQPLAMALGRTYLMPLVAGANAACVGGDYTTSIAAVSAMFTLAQIVQPLSHDQVTTLADLALTTMKFSQCPALQFEAVKLIGALMANVVDLFPSQGEMFFSAVLAQLGALSQVHEISACRQLVEQLLGMLIKT